MLSAIKRFGNSAGLVIPKPVLAEFCADVGDSVDMRVEEGRIVIERVKSVVRDGWAEDAKAIAALGDDKLIWPEFVNIDDGAFEW
jgi:antitoxin MazE